MPNDPDETSNDLDDAGNPPALAGILRGAGIGILFWGLLIVALWMLS